MSKPYSQPSKKVLLSAITGVYTEGNTPKWMDRQYGYTPKKSKGGNTKKQRSR